MFFQVVIKDNNGNVKDKITEEQLSKRHWDNYNPNPHFVITPRTKEEKRNAMNSRMTDNYEEDHNFYLP